MNYLEKVNKKCREYNLYESIELDLNVFNDIYLDTLLDFYKKNAYEFHEDESIVLANIRFDYNNVPYFEFKTDYGNFISVLTNGIDYQGLDHSFIVFEGYISNHSFKKFLDIKINEFRKRVINSDSARYEYRSYMAKSLDKIISSIDDYYSADNRDFISFYSVSDKGEKRNPFSEITGSSNERKNEVMDFDIRCEVLENSKYTYKIEAFDRNRDEVENDYVVYCYNLPDKKVRLIAEPISGCKYTKVAYLKKEDMSLEDAKDVSKQLLEYSQSDITDINNITRHRHLEIEQYKKMIRYILGNSEDIGYGMKRSIDEASSYAERYFVRKK